MVRAPWLRCGGAGAWQDGGVGVGWATALCDSPSAVRCRPPRSCGPLRSPGAPTRAARPHSEAKKMPSLLVTIVRLTLLVGKAVIPTEMEQPNYLYSTTSRQVVKHTVGLIYCGLGLPARAYIACYVHGGNTFQSILLPLKSIKSQSTKRRSSMFNQHTGYICCTTQRERAEGGPGRVYLRVPY